MRKYYWCDANMMVYTEKEKQNSIFSSGRFHFVRMFKNRAAAEKCCEENLNLAVVTGGKRR